MQAPDLVRVNAYFDTPEQRAAAESMLRDTSQAVDVFDACVQGWTTPDRLAELVAHGILVDIVDAPPPAAGNVFVPPVQRPATRSAGIHSRLMRGDEDTEIVERSDGDLDEALSETDRDVLEAMSAAASGFHLGDGGVAVDEPTTRGEGAAPAREPASSGSGDRAASVEQVFRVRVDGILRPSDRATLSSAGAHLLAMEPPVTFLAYMNADARRAVEALPFVEGTTAQGMADSVTDDLLEVVRASRRLSSQDRGGRLLAEGVEDQDSGQDIPDQYDLICHRPQDVAVVSDLMSSTPGIEVVGTSDVIVRIRIDLPADELTALAGRLTSHPNIRTVSPYRAPRLLCDYARRLIGIEAINTGPGHPRWTGTGERVAIFDSGVDDRHPDLETCVVHKAGVGRGSAIDRFGHGTHVAGIVAGNGTCSDGQIQGIAPGAQLVVFGIVDDEGSLDLPPDLGSLLQRAVDQGARIINLSWGSPLPGPYDGYSLTIDRFVRSHPDVLVVVAAGNEGSAPPPSGLPPFRTIDTPASAKNVVTVGASTTDRPGFDASWGAYRQDRFRSPPTALQLMAGDPDVPAALSSRGPTEFMSVKPDVLAPGTFILSTKARNFSPLIRADPYPQVPDRYIYLHGTSMAAPVVSGAAAIIRQYLRVERGLPEPSAALVKAMLIASARRVPSIRSEKEDVGYPDFDQGFGRIDLSSILSSGEGAPSLAFVDVANGSPDALEALTHVDSGRKGNATYLATVEPGSTGQLNAVLTWTDYAAAYVQNNLELVVNGPGVPIAVGNPEWKYGRSDIDRLLGGGNSELLDAIPDKYNSVEQVVLADPKPGQYRIRVVAQNTPFPEGGQGYALVMVGGSSTELQVG